MNKKGFAMSEIAKILLVLLVFIGLVLMVILLNTDIFDSTSHASETVINNLNKSIDSLGELTNG